MTAQRFLVSTSIEGRKLSLAWDSTRPLIVGKNESSSGWLVERVDNGDVRVRSLASGESRGHNAHSKVIPLKRAQSGVEVKFSREAGESLELEIHEIAQINAVDYRARTGVFLSKGFVAYSTVSDWTTRMTVHRKEFRAFFLKDEIFRAVVGNDGVRFMASESGVEYQIEGSNWQPLSRDKPVTLSENDFFRATVRWEKSKWYFSGIVEGVRDRLFETPPPSKDTREFQKVSAVSLLLFLLFFLGGRMLSPPKLEEEKPLPAQIVKLLKKKPAPKRATKKLEIPGEKAPEETPQPIAQVEAPAEAPKPEQIVVPKGNPAPEVAKRDPAPPKAAPPRTVAKTKPKSKVENLTAGLMKGGLTKILNSNDILKSAKLGQNGQFRGDTKAMSAALSGVQLNLGAIGDTKGDAKIKGFGGSDSGGAKGNAAVGYGDGVKGGSLSGTGASQISLGIKDAEIEEGLTREEVGKVIHAHMKEIRYCYEDAMVRSPASKVEGTVALAFTINGKGNVSTSRVSQNEVGGSNLGECIRRRLDTWKFPNPKGGVNVNITYPFIFNTLGGG